MILFSWKETPPQCWEEDALHTAFADGREFDYRLLKTNQISI